MSSIIPHPDLDIVGIIADAAHLVKEIIAPASQE
jgi:hypothetical protein